MDKSVKFSVNDVKGSGLAKYSIAYASRKLGKQLASYKILTALKGLNNMIIELDSGVISISQKEKNAVVDKYIESLEKLGVEYKNKKVKTNYRRTILSIPIENKMVDGYEVYSVITPDIWASDEFEKIIPEFGMHYYILKPDLEVDLNAFSDLDDDGKYELCDMAIFDNISFGHMGINTDTFEKDDILKLLEKKE